MNVEESVRIEVPGMRHRILRGRSSGAAQVLVYLHGLGCAGSRDWPPVAHSAALSHHASIWFDLLGFGQSDRPQDFSYELAEQARLLAALLASRAGPVALVGHSMGGTLGILVAEELTRAGRPPAALLVAEPNLRPEDATGSAVAAATPLDVFVAKWDQFVESMSAPSYRESLRMADPVAFHRSATSLVRLGQGGLIPRLAALPVPVKGYILGALSDETTHETARQVAAAGIPVATVEASGHGFSEDNPEGLGSAIALLLTGA
ncbi:alpha/beta fold hydrolase [Pyxidicoccus xibeiensis]|uniref:alpha/beta fold hydrolase n=1 Tax=Pyxidicoccus xibeiensis TaxID=2906759 RepID=UPI0020A71D1C|nr:alpha/beta hydrolase [Pyxidicoccus xibeiensis]MCP3145217.1 alpha/beta hydrolase [Pyxidicoccus xibeiensis]